MNSNFDFIDLRSIRQLRQGGKGYAVCGKIDQSAIVRQCKVVMIVGAGIEIGLRTLAHNFPQHSSGGKLI